MKQIKQNEPIEVPVLRYYMQSACMAGEQRHAQTHLKDIGVQWRLSECHTVGDCWFFWIPSGNLEALPVWLKDEIIMVDPVKFWGDDNKWAIEAGQKVLRAWAETNQGN
jgi:hypothetical protein